MKSKGTLKENRIFFLVLVAFYLMSGLKFFDGEMSYFNSTLYAFSYKYGFISRGFVGSCYQALNKLVPVDMMTYMNLYYFTALMTFVLFGFILLFYRVALDKCETGQERNERLLMSFLAVFLFPMFVSAENFGRIDIYFYMLTFICLMLIMAERAEWLCVPLVAVCMCIHHGYTFTTVNIILVLLLFKALKSSGKKTKYYGIIFALTFIVVSVLFLYFEFFSHMQGADIAESIKAAAMPLSQSGKDYNTTIVNHEILGKDVYEDEIAYHICNRQETPVALLCFSPYLIIAFTFFKNLLKKKTKKDKMAYLAVVLGAFTLLPECILKVDFGRYFFFTFFYYIAITICLIALRDRETIEAFELTKVAVKKRMKIPYVLIAYPLIFMPFSDWYISDVTLAIMDAIKAFIRMI